MIRLGLGGALVAERKKAELCWTDPTMARARDRSSHPSKTEKGGMI
jgi:hypothetical protein